ncbi:MAG: phage portal protein [Peptostreptococcaceae bacterium]|nr:phage portal protein [Peptostreptococcaceae bacterium]
MIRLEKFEPTAENVGKIVDYFRHSQLPRLNRLWDYYDAKTDKKKEHTDPERPDNKLAHAYARYITTIQTGYFMGVNVKYRSSNEEYLEKYTSLLKDNFEEDVNFELAKSQSIFGYGVELVYQNKVGDTRFKKLDPREVILVFSPQIEEFLLCAIRYYQSQEIGGDIVQYAVVYTDEEIKMFKQSGEDKGFTLAHIEENIFKEIPIVIYKNNEEMKSDYEDMLTLNNAYDTSQSNTANDVDYFNDAYMLIKGYNDVASGADMEDGAVGDSSGRSGSDPIQKGRLIYFPDGGDARFLTKDINDSATENYKSRLNSDIHKFSLTPDLADEKFAGNLSGIAIKFKTIPLEQNAKPKENKFRVGLRKRREIISRIFAIKGKAYDYREIDEEFTRNLPVNALEETNRILAMAPFISRRTLLEKLIDIEDVDEEIKRLSEESDEYDHREYGIDLERLDAEPQETE